MALLVLLLHIFFYWSALSSRAYLVDDSIQYLTLSENLVEEGIYSQQYASPYAPDLQRPPGYPILLLLSGGHFWVVLLLQHIMVLAAGYFLFRMLSLLVSEKWARRGGWFWLLQPYPILMASFVLSEAPFICMMALGLWLYFAYRRSHCPWQLLPGLAALAGAAYFRPVGLLLLALLAGEAAWRAVRRCNWRALGVAVLLPPLLIGPWVLRNGTATGHYTFSSMGPIGMVHGRAGGLTANLQKSPMEEHYWFMAGDSLAAKAGGLAAIKEYPKKVQIHETEVYRGGLGLALKTFAAHPLEAVKMQFRALLAMLKGVGHGWALRITQSQAMALGSGIWQGICNLLMFLGTGLALLRLGKMPKGSVLLLAAMALLYLTSMAVWADGRYRVPIDLIHLALATAAFEGLWLGRREAAGKEIAGG